MATREILTGSNYYHYYFYGFLTCVVFAMYHYFFGNNYIFISTSSAAIFLMVIIVVRMLGKDSSFLRSAALAAVVATIFSTCYFLGIRGTTWLFPLIIGLFFNYSKQCALIVSLLVVLVGLILAANTVEFGTVFRMLFPLSLTIGFAYLYRATIEKEQYLLEKEASEDYLTGIRNRRSFHGWLQRAISYLEKDDYFLAVFYLDVDDFKLVNDTYGHEIGDRVLQEVSNRLVGSMRQTDVIGQANKQQFARIAGDEFVIAASHIEHKHSVDIIANRLLASINAPLTINGVEFKLSTSIGVTIVEDHTVSAEDLLREADAAMYRSKEQGKNRVTYFDEQIASQIKQKQQIARGIEEALRKEEFFLNFMPIFKLDTKQQAVLAGAEVLIRCQSEALMGIGPDQYIPVAEECGSIRYIDLYVIKRSFQLLCAVQESLPKDFILAINISAKELYNEDFPAQLDALATDYAINRNLVELEITETSLVDYDEKIIVMLQTIKDKGFKLSLDDFGTGYTAFSQLQNYPVDTLKIDRSFVWNITDANQDQEKMVDVILSLAKLYDVKIVAEGVETQGQLDYLARSKCDYFQGFYLAKPMPWETFQDEYLAL